MSFSRMTDDGVREELVQHLLDQRRCLGCWSAALVGNGEVSGVHTFTEMKAKFGLELQPNPISFPITWS